MRWRRAPPVLSPPQRAELDGTSQRDHQHQAARQAADQRRCDHFPGCGFQAVLLIASIEAVLMAVTLPHFKDAPFPTVEVSGLTLVAVGLVRPVRTAPLVVAAL